MKQVPVSNMRLFTATTLREMTEPALVFCHSEPIAVVVPYAVYQRYQRCAQELDEYKRIISHVAATGELRKP